MTEEEKRAIQTAGELTTLKNIVGSLLAHIAARHDDPEGFVMNITAPYQSVMPERAGDEGLDILYMQVAKCAEEIERHAISSL